MRKRTTMSLAHLAAALCTSAALALFPSAALADEDDAAEEVVELVAGADHEQGDPAGEGAWVEEGGATYYELDGERQVGWLELGGSRYYLDPAASGALAYGWQDIAGRWYYLDPEDGHALTGLFTDGSATYAALPSGACVPNAWYDIDGAWYLTKADCSVATGWRCVGGSWYLLGADGAMLTGWQDPSGSATWYYLDPSSGAMRLGWQFLDGTWYYFLPSGAMARGAFQQANGDWGVTDSAGRWIKVSDWQSLDNQVIPIAAARGLDLRTCYDYVRYNYTYKKKDLWPSYDHWQEDYATKMIAERQGNCYSFACLFHFLARACGLENYVVQGNVVWPRTGKTIAHGWVEAVVDGHVYIFDPEMQYEFPTKNGYFEDSDYPTINYVHVA